MKEADVTVKSGQKRVKEVINESIWALGERDGEALRRALLDPPKPGLYMKEAVSGYKRRITG